MERSWWWKFGFILAVTLASFWLLIPSYYSLVVLPREQRNNVKLLEEQMPSWAPPARYRLNLGLDLQGGIHMVMRVDTRTALQKRVDRRGVQIVNYLKDKKLGDVKVDADPERLRLTMTAADPAGMDAIEKEVLATFEDFSKVSREGATLTIELDESMASRFKTEAVDQAMLVIRRRIDKWGVAEADIRKQGNDAIQISLPGQKDPEKAKELIGTTAQLEFRMVDDSKPYFQTMFQQTPPDAADGITVTSSEGYPQLEAKQREPLMAYVAGKLPADREVMLECVEGAKKGSCTSYRSHMVDKNVPLTGDSLASAEADYDQNGAPLVRFGFDAQGARDFGQLTESNIGKRLAIVLDGDVKSAPTIQSKIEGSGQITLGRRAGVPATELLEEAQNLALVLKAGALPAPVTTGEIRQVGATLGDEMIKKGSLAAIVGLLLVLVFMAVYYAKSGLIADVALILNGLLILMFLAMLNATLTLPGIAGFVLTLGIAVDANVLINERIREELANGKTARAAVDQGYDRAFWTIFDAHVTTLIAGVILFYTGTGPVRGFATTLIIGIVASLFTSIVVTRVITTYFVHGRNASTVSV